MSKLDALRAAIALAASDHPNGAGVRPTIEDGTGAWSYGDLAAAIDLWTARLDAAGARRVAYRLPNGRDWIALDLALLLSDRVAIPIPEFFSPEQERHVLATSGADTYVSATCRQVPEFQVSEGSADWMLMRARPETRPPLHPGTAKITFTSGTTGRPKGVCLSSTHQLATATAICTALGRGSVVRHLCVLPLALLLENVVGIYANLLNGSTIVAPDLTELGISGSSGMDVAKFTAALNRLRPESVILVPQLLMAMTMATEFGIALPDSLRVVAVGGGKVPPTLIARAARVGIPVFEGYGLTECGSVVALNLPRANRIGSVGKPLDHATVRIVGDEIAVDGGTMLGYLGEAAQTGPVATGDLGSIDADGYLHVHGRRKNCFITAFGRNVSPEWPESELQTEFPIAHALVFGEALPRNCALIVPRGSPVDEQLQAAVDRANARLPDYARITHWRAVDPAEFAAGGCLTPNGRPRRAVAAERFAELLGAMHAEIEEETNEFVRTAQG